MTRAARWLASGRTLAHAAGALLCALALQAGPATAAGAAPAVAPAPDDRQLGVLTRQLLDALHAHERLPAGDTRPRAASEATLARLAQHRLEQLLQLVERDPRRAAAQLLPAAMRPRFPAAARAAIEEAGVEMDGMLMVLVSDDFERGVSREIWMFQPDGEGGAGPMRLHLADPAATGALPSSWAGQPVRLRGTRVDGHLFLLQLGDLQRR